jgi:hypothetical protein
MNVVSQKNKLQNTSILAKWGIIDLMVKNKLKRKPFWATLI